MKTALALLLLGTVTSAGVAGEFSQPDPSAHPDLFLWNDTCNVWLLRGGNTALLFNLGDGTVLDHLGEIGVEEVDWVLLTDHHRESSQGIDRLDRAHSRVAAPKEEQALFETPRQFRKWHPRLADPFTVHGSSYVRPPREALKVDHWLAPEEIFEWQGRRIRCVATPGHSPGGMTFLVTEGESTCAFLGGVMHDGARMTNWFDTEWDYGFAKGLDTLIDSVDKLASLHPDLAFATQGPMITGATAQLVSYREKLTIFRPDYVRGFPFESFSKRPAHPAMKPTKVPFVVQVTPHLYMFGPEMAGRNFAIIISDAGHGLLLDCGLFSSLVLERIIGDMKQHLGLKQIDACWISHSHGDHFTLFAALQEYGVKFWTMDTIVDKCENPRAYDYPAMIGAYNAGFEKAKIDRVLHSGDVIDWEGYQLHIDWMPGQTEFGNALWLELDGKRIVFTGDNLFGDPSDPTQNGHEGVVARNSAITEEGYLVAAKYLQDLKPDILMGAHSVLMTEPAAFVDRYREWSERIIRRYKALLPEEDYEYLFDPYWVSAYPYRVDLTRANTATVNVTIRNFRDRPQQHRVELKLPPGIEAEPRILEGVVEAESRRTFPVTLKATDRALIGAGVRIATFDITLDRKHYGELFDFLVQAKEPIAEGSSAP